MVAITRNSLDYLGLAGYPEAYFGLYLIYKYGVPGVAPDHMKARRYLRPDRTHGSCDSDVVVGLELPVGPARFSQKQKTCHVLVSFTGETLE